jgi:hypothetical protein
MTQKIVINIGLVEQVLAAHTAFFHSPARLIFISRAAVLIQLSRETVARNVTKLAGQ